MITGKDCQITQKMSGVKLHELSLRDPGNLPKPWRALTLEQSLGVLSPEGANHSFTLLSVNRMCQEMTSINDRQLTARHSRGAVKRPIFSLARGGDEGFLVVLQGPWYDAPLRPSTSLRGL